MDGVYIGCVKEWGLAMYTGHCLWLIVMQHDTGLQIYVVSYVWYDTLKRSYIFYIYTLLTNHIIVFVTSDDRSDISAQETLGQNGLKNDVT